MASINVGGGHLCCRVTCNLFFCQLPSVFPILDTPLFSVYHHLTIMISSFSNMYPHDIPINTSNRTTFLTVSRVGYFITISDTLTSSLIPKNNGMPLVGDGKLLTNFCNNGSPSPDAIRTKNL